MTVFYGCIVAWWDRRKFYISLISNLLHNPLIALSAQNYSPVSFAVSTAHLSVQHLSICRVYISLLFSALYVSSYLFVCSKFFPFQSPSTTESTVLKRRFYTPPASFFPLLLQGYYRNTSLHPLDLGWYAVNINCFSKIM